MQFLVEIIEHEVARRRGWPAAHKVGVGSVVFSARHHDVSILTTSGVGLGRCLGSQPASKNSMMNIRPPQHGQGHGSAQDWSAGACELSGSCKRGASTINGTGRRSHHLPAHQPASNRHRARCSRLVFLPRLRALQVCRRRPTLRVAPVPTAGIRKPSQFRKPSQSRPSRRATTNGRSTSSSGKSRNLSRTVPAICRTNCIRSS